MSRLIPGRFSMGGLFMTHTINATREESAKFAKEIKTALDRYISCDWGDLTASDKESNDKAVRFGKDRILAAFATSEGRIYIITEHDRSYTTIMFCDEY